MLGRKAVSSVLLQQAFSWSFLLAAVQFPIIGVDFLCHFGLLVDLAATQLVDQRKPQVFKSSTLLSRAASSPASVSAVTSRPPARLPEDILLSSSLDHRPLLGAHQPLLGDTGLSTFMASSPDHRPLLLHPLLPPDFAGRFTDCHLRPVLEGRH